MAADLLLPAVRDEAAYRAVHGDPTPWLPAVRTICERHGLDPEAAYQARGGTNVVFRIRGGPWIKLFPPLWPQDAVRERTGLAAVASVDGLAVPRLLAEGELEGWPYLVLSHLEGRAAGAVWPELDEAARIGVMHELGALLARIHAVDLGACATIAEDWPTYAAGLREDAVARQAGQGLPPIWVTALAAFVADLPPMDTGTPVFLHADVTDEHVLLGSRGEAPQVTGLIDFGDAMVGDPLYEFAAPLVFLAQRQPAVQRALLEGYGMAPADLDEALGRRLVGWMLLHRWGRIGTYVRFTPGAAPTSFEDLVRALWTPA